jgi:endonuclease-3
VFAFLYGHAGRCARDAPDSIGGTRTLPRAYGTTAEATARTQHATHRRLAHGGIIAARRRGSPGACQSQGCRARMMVSVAAASRRRTRLRPEQINELFSRLRELNPTPTTELAWSNPFELLVAVILSAQATDVGVNKATRRLFAIANTPGKMIVLGEVALKRHIATIGLYNTKAANVIAMSRLLIEHHHSEVPRTREALEALPGVGRKTANVVLNTVFGEPTIAVDTHIFRVSNRTGLAPGKTVREVEDTLMRVVPVEYRQHAHHWLILHGRYVCKARTPDCPHCPIRDLCRYPDKTS